MSTDDTTVTLAADTLTGDLATWLIDRLRNLECAFRYLSEDQQREQIVSAKQAVERLVKEAVNIIAADGRSSIPGKCVKVVNDGKKLQAVIEVSTSSEHRHDLLDAVNFPVQMLVADAEKFDGGDVPDPEPDQRGLEV